MLIDRCSLSVPIISDGDYGDLIVIENMRNIPFKIKRIFYIFNVGINQTRGNHAHKKLTEAIFCLKGSFDIKITNSDGEVISLKLNKPNQGLILEPMHWVEQSNFTRDAICLVLADDYFKESDYIRDKKSFLNL